MERKKHHITKVDEDLGIIDEVLKNKRMKTLEQIKDEVAERNGYKDFIDLIDMCPSSVTNEAFDKIAELYAAQFKPVWISVEKDLPPVGVEVYVLYKPKQPQMGGGYSYGLTKRPDVAPDSSIAKDKNFQQHIRDNHGFFYGGGTVYYWMHKPPLPQKD